MSCQNHPNRESISNCQFCGKELCEECAITIAGKNYCEDCMSDLIGPELVSIANNKSYNADIPYNTNKEGILQENQIPNQNQIPAEGNLSSRDLQRPVMGENNLAGSEISTEPQLDNNYNDLYSDDRLYNDIHPENTITPNKEIEEKYERYLDDLYFDEKAQPKEEIKHETPENMSLSDQLAMDEAKHGSITREAFIPEVPEESVNNQEEIETFNENENRTIPIMKNLRNENLNMTTNKNENENREYVPSSLHRQSIHYKKEEKTPISSTERILTVILILLIILVAIYVIYLLTLHSQYPNFLDAVTAFFTNPGEVIGLIFS
jgi:hypothetical protein